MIVRKTLNPIIVIKVAWKRVLALGIVSTLVVFSYHHLWIDLSVDTLPASILGVAIAFLIGFRVNSAYERWWEARKVWGSITNDSRSLGRQIMTFLSPVHKGVSETKDMSHLQNQMIKRQIAFCYALKNTLRKQEVIADIQKYLDETELEWIKSQKNIPLALLQKQGESLQYAHANGYIEDFRHMQMDLKVSALVDSMGACERIKNTVFPRQYSYYSTQFVKLYTFLLPFILVANSGWITVPFTIIIGFIFFALDTIASGIENPFENTLNDTPMSAICRNIEINLLQMINESELPDPMQPHRGFLY